MQQFKDSNPPQSQAQKKVNNLLDNDPSRPGFDGAFMNSLGNKYLDEIYHRPLDPLGEIHPTMLDPIEERYGLTGVGGTPLPSRPRTCRVMSSAEIARIAARDEANYFNITDAFGGFNGQLMALWVEGWAYYGQQNVQQLGPFNLVGFGGAGSSYIQEAVGGVVGNLDNVVPYGTFVGEGHDPALNKVPVGNLAANYVIITQEPPWPHRGGAPGARYATGGEKFRRCCY